MTCPPAMSPLGILAPGHPMAPRRIASELSLQCSNEPSGHSSPVSRKYWPPHGISVMSKDSGLCSSNTSMTRIACTMTSRPVPSPGSTVKRYSLTRGALAFHSSTQPKNSFRPSRRYLIDGQCERVKHGPFDGRWKW